MSLPKKFLSVLLALVCLSPFFASAHEVYVLTQPEVRGALSVPSPNPLNALSSEMGLFLSYGVGIVILGILVILFGVNARMQGVFNPFLFHLKKYAPFIARLTLGLSLLASGYYHAIFGPELPVTGSLATLLIILGVLIIVGCLTRVAALIGIGIFVFMVIEDRSYMIMYANYFGEMVLAFIVGGGLWSLDRSVGWLQKIEGLFNHFGVWLERYSFLILRVSFGLAIIFASFYAKFLHSNLALDTVADYHLTNYFHFTPLFLVLGAFLVEMIIGLCFLIGFQVRFAALVFIFFLIQSILFFGEAVWPHIILFGVNFALFAHGYDQYTLGHFFQGARKGEPVL